ncbi:hypothetical protein LUZ63_019819 [Rhynchospora breviuscula]|uniref:Hexosyltransferase n=1 Tax=Rhynchospora breviuscula TaxID=2022672 RepID=A0A9Q0C770_9POAL|nr:hypothetical protein LUZ63_019819 [Rhynchospora breviuscula]
MSFAPSSKESSPSKLAYVLFLALALLITFFIFHGDYLIASTASADVSLTTTDMTSITTVKPEFHLFIGVVTMPELYTRRHLLRTLFSLQTYDKSIAEIDIRFIFCNLTSEDQRVFVAMEIVLHDDIIILDCKENMNEGKTYKFLYELAKWYSDEPYNFVMKTDDDSYIILEELIQSLRDKPRFDMYYGIKIPCDKEDYFPYQPFMEGMGYVLSWDLVEWIATSDLPRNDHNGPEDMWTGMWFNLAGKAKNRFDMSPRIYDYKGAAETNCFRHDFIPESILVHRLKQDFEWVNTLNYFNVTSGLKPSKFYNIL